MNQNRQSGFTLIEMLVIAPIVILAIGAFVTVIISMTGEVLSSRGSNTLAYNIQDAVSRIEQDVKQSTSFLSTNNITLTASQAQGYNNDATNFTNISGASGTSLILSSVVTNGSPTDPSTGVVYLSNQPNTCASANVKNNKPMLMNIVYFVKPDASGISSLWRRTIMPSNYLSAGCSTPYQQPSCFPSYMDTTPSPTLCKTKDVLLVQGVAPGGLNLEYFSAASATTANTVASTSTDPSARGAALITTPTVSVSISASQSVGGRTIERSATLRATRLEINATAIADIPVQSTMSTPPSGLVVTGSSSTQVSLAWSAPAGTPTSYSVQYSQKSDFSSPTTINGITSTSRTVTGLPTARGQFFRVAATNSFGTTSYSSGVLGNTTGNNVWSNYIKIASVSDWNKDGKNDLMGLTSTGDVYLHTGNGNLTFEDAVLITNIGTNVRNFLGPGTPPSGNAPILWWTDTTGAAYALRSDGNYGISGSVINSAPAGSFSSCIDVFAAPFQYSNYTTVMVNCRTNSITKWLFNSSAVVTAGTTAGSGWSPFATDKVFGAGDFSVDGKGDFLAIGTDGTMTFYQGDGAGFVTSSCCTSSGWLNDRVSGGWDLNSDGRPDVIRFVTTTNTFYVYTSVGNGNINGGIVVN